MSRVVVNNNANAVAASDSAADSLIRRVRLLSKEECGMEEAARRSSPDLAQSVASPISSESVFINAESANQGRYSMLRESIGFVITAEITLHFLLARGWQRQRLWSTVLMRTNF